MNPINYSKQMKPIPFTHYFKVQTPCEKQRLVKLRLHIKSIELLDDRVKLNNSIALIDFPKFERAKFKFLKGLVSLYSSSDSQNVFHILSSVKSIFYKLRKLSIKTKLYPWQPYSKAIKKSLNNMKFLTYFEDLSSLYAYPTNYKIKVHPLRRVQSLKLPFHLVVDKLPSLKCLTIDLNLLSKMSIPKLPVQIEELSLIDHFSQEVPECPVHFQNIRNQLNLLESLKILNLVFSFRNYYQGIFKHLTLKELKINMHVCIDFSEETLVDMNDFVNRTASIVRINPSSYSTAVQYVRLLDFLSGGAQATKRLKLESVLYDFNSEGKLQERVIEYYQTGRIALKAIIFLFELNSSKNWFDSQSCNNLKRMLDCLRAQENPQIKVIFSIQYTQNLANGVEEQSKGMDDAQALHKKIREKAVSLLHYQAGPQGEILNGIVKEIRVKELKGYTGQTILMNFMTEMLKCYKVEVVNWECYSSIFMGKTKVFLETLKSKRCLKMYYFGKPHLIY